ncbi:uncharacterized protein LOC123317878 [Coccinella septempunctata]|uniref:uncharacterized protein LOC123317878 n=1 Tax=Coccinella septempunctata TaxID=41139 RepID=UPI001D08CC20|nr:uncharacterized protein LOC123317878 [Coccinella septempunctata]
MEENTVMNENTEEQECRAFLRSRYLYFISSLCASKLKCHIQMYDNTSITCVIRAIDLNFENIIVDNLRTPFPKTARKAILRITDIISIELDKNMNLLKIQ